MEAVRAFNNELSSLYEGRPPISRAKMASVTKSAMKAIKFYKHVVQSVEKFINKCKPEYKVPGLYVIDSIVRQSRHQFGQEKDMFSPRFSKNIVVTFQSLFKCPPDEKSKIIRVLNLWQKNYVFPSDIIQVLLNLAEDPGDDNLVLAAEACVEKLYGPSKVKTLKPSVEKVKIKAIPEAQNEMLNTVNQLLQQTKEPQTIGQQQHQIQQLQLLQQQLLQQTQIMQDSQQESAIDSNLLSQIQVLTNQLLSKQALEDEMELAPKAPPEPALEPQPGFKKLLEFDYGESDEEDDSPRKEPPPQMKPDEDSSLMQRIKEMDRTIQHNQQLRNEIDVHQQMLRRQTDPQPLVNAPPPEPQPQVYNPPQPLMSLNPTPMPLHHVNMQQAPQPSYNHNHHQGHIIPDEMTQENIPPVSVKETDYHHGDRGFREDRPEREREDADNERDDRKKKDKSHKSRERRSRSRSQKRRRRSRSRSRDRRRRSRSRDKHRRSRSRDRDDRDKRDRERRRKALAPIRDRHISVCTTTIWLGHLPKTTTEHEIAVEVEQFGVIQMIHMVPPRGCAFVCMSERKDAARALDKMKGSKINGSTIKIAWAPGKGIKESNFQDNWNVENGVTYIHWDQLPKDVTPLLDGGVIDEETLPENLKGSTPLKKAAPEPNNAVIPMEPPQDRPTPENIQLPTQLPPPGLPPVEATSAPQFMAALPGMLPGRPPFPGALPGQHIPGMPPGMLPMMAPGMLHPQMMIPMPSERLQMAVGSTSVLPTHGLPMMSVPGGPGIHTHQMPLMRPPFDMQRLPILPGMPGMPPTVRLPGFTMPDARLMVPPPVVDMVTNDIESDGTPIEDDDEKQDNKISDIKESESSQEMREEAVTEKIKPKNDVPQESTDAEKIEKAILELKERFKETGLPGALGPPGGPPPIRGPMPPGVGEPGMDMFQPGPRFNPDFRMRGPPGQFPFNGPPGGFSRFRPPPGFNPNFHGDGPRFPRGMSDDFHGPPRQFFRGPPPDNMGFRGPRPLMEHRGPRPLMDDRFFNREPRPLFEDDNFPPPNDNEQYSEFNEEEEFYPNEEDNFNRHEDMDHDQGHFHERNDEQRNDHFHDRRNNEEMNRGNRGSRNDRKSRWSDLNNVSDKRSDWREQVDFQEPVINETEADEDDGPRNSLASFLQRLSGNPVDKSKEENSEKIAEVTNRTKSVLNNLQSLKPTLPTENHHQHMSLDNNLEMENNFTEEPYSQEPIKEEQFTQEPVKEGLFTQEPIKEEQFTQEPVKEVFFTQETVKGELFTQETVKGELFSQETVKGELFTQETVKEDLLTQEPVKEEQFTQETFNEEPQSQTNNINNDNDSSLAQETSIDKDELTEPIAQTDS